MTTDRGSRAPLHLRPLAAGLAGFERLRFAWMRWANDHRVAAGLGLQFRPREDDLWVVGYPRSGAILLQVILLELAGRGGFDFVHLESRSPIVDVELARGNAGFLAVLPSPRILRSFRRREELPRRGRFVYLARDLFDVAASAYRHNALLSGHDPDRRKFFSRFRRGHVILSPSWFDHLRSWWPHRNDPDVLFLDYDEVVGDLDGAIRRVAAFSGLGVDEGRMAEIRDRSSLATMKRHAGKLDPRLRRIDEQQVAFIRGARGAKRPPEIPPAERRLIAARVQSFARRLGVHPDDPFAALFRT